MNESKWRSCADLERMLTFLTWRASQRKLRLVAVGFCRQVWRHLPDERHRQVVQLVERFADGLVSERELTASRKPRLVPIVRAATWDSDGAAARAAAREAQAIVGAYDARRRQSWIARAVAKAASQEHARLQCDLIREIVNPFWQGEISPSWLAWNGGMISSLAQAIYDERDFSRLPILADALEESGCADATLLSHCREPNGHFLGCWALDLILGKA